MLGDVSSNVDPAVEVVAKRPAHTKPAAKPAAAIDKVCVGSCRAAGWDWTNVGCTSCCAPCMPGGALIRAAAMQLMCCWGFVLLVHQDTVIDH